MTPTDVSASGGNTVTPTADEPPQNASRRRLLQGATALASTLAASAALASTARPPASSGEAPADSFDVVIIGGGLAGLTAARDLHRSGNRSFVVLEARNRVGGRTLNHQLRHGYISEAGGQWVGTGQTAVTDLARELEIGTFKSDFTGRGVYRMGKGRVEDDTHGGVDLDPKVLAEFDALARSLRSTKPWLSANAKELDKMSVTDWLAKRNVNQQDMLTWQFATVLTMGSSMANTSLLQYLGLVNCAGGFQVLEAQKDGAQESRFHGGSQALSIKMAEELKAFVRLEHPVLKITGWDQAITEVHTPHGVFRARKVIVALSPSLCHRISYEPALPADRQQLHRRWPTHGPFAKTAMVYDEPFWFKKGYNGQTGCVTGPVIWSYDNSPPDKKLGVINAFVRVGELPSNHDAAERMLADIYADSFNDKRFLKPLEYHLQDWGQEPYTLSCVPPMPPGFMTSGLMPALTRNVGALIWSGTETADIWYGYMDGAVRSGHRAALEALQSLNGRKGVAA